MTLYRQLFLCTFITLACLCTGLWMGELKRTGAFLVNQMETHAQDTATSLGLSLTTLANGDDIPAMETMINALFDRGYYRIIELRDIEGNLLIDRRSDLTLEHIPTWFIHLVPLNAPQATSLIMHGWQQTGAITVESHPGYAYQTLWQAAQATALWFSLTCAGFTLLGGLGLRSLLKPLHNVEKQAMALCDRQFHVQERLPRTRELRSVVTAMNRMTVRIREMFDEQAATADTLLQRTYQDPLTATGNRRYLEAQIKAKLEDKETPVTGSFLLLQIQELQAINQKKGYQTADQLIIDTATLIQQACKDLPEAIIGRLGGGDFALLLPNSSGNTTKQVAESILEDFHQQAAARLPLTTEILACCGGVIYEQTQTATFSQLLTRADTALNTARYHRDNKAVILPLVDGDGPVSVGKSEWQELLKNVLDNRSIALYSQPIVSHRDMQQTVHHEILTRVIDASGKHLSVGMFIPMAERLGLMPALDRMIIERLFEQPLQKLSPLRVAVNLSPLSLTDSDFVAWLHRQLVHCAKQGIQLNFEFPEFRALRYTSLIKEFSEVIKKQGHHLGIDHFGQGLVHFGYLKSLLPNYVKIDRAITGELRDEQSDSYFFINALCNVAHSLDIKVIVEGVENETQWQTLAKLHIDAVQGFYVQQPEPFAKQES